MIQKWKIKTRWLRFYRKSVPGMVLEKSIQDRIPNRAAGLSFTTLLALIPIFTVILSFGGFDNIETSLQNFIVKSILPASQEPILTMLNEFALNSKRLGTWGLLVSMVIIVLLLNTIEKTFNQILRTRPSKDFFVRVSTYIATLVFGILLIGASLTFTGNFSGFWSQLTGLEKLITRPFFLGLFSISTITISLILMFILIPAGQVRFKPVLTGALFGGIFWEGAKQLFSLWAGHSVRNSVIYGGFFLIPLTFIWVDLGWIIILGALEITYVKQHGNIPKGSRRGIELPKERMILSLEIYLYICRLFQKRRRPPRLIDICNFTQLSEESTLILLEPFIQRKLIYIVKEKVNTYVPSTELDRIHLKEVIHVILNGNGKAKPFLEEKGGRIWEHFLFAGSKDLEDKTVRDLLETTNFFQELEKRSRDYRIHQDIENHRHNLH